MNIKDGQLYPVDNWRTEPIAIQEIGNCSGCGRDSKVWAITDSSWEYPGTKMCAGCLLELANQLTLDKKETS